MQVISTEFSLHKVYNGLPEALIIVVSFVVYLKNVNEWFYSLNVEKM